MRTWVLTLWLSSTREIPVPLTVGFASHHLTPPPACLFTWWQGYAFWVFTQTIATEKWVQEARGKYLLFCLGKHRGCIVRVLQKNRTHERHIDKLQVDVRPNPQKLGRGSKHLLRVVPGSSMFCWPRSKVFWVPQWRKFSQATAEPRLHWRFVFLRLALEGEWRTENSWLFYHPLCLALWSSTFLRSKAGRYKYWARSLWPQVISKLFSEKPNWTFIFMRISCKGRGYIQLDVLLFLFENFNPLLYYF